MFVKISNPSVDAYDSNTNRYIGEARFDLTQEAERELLNWINGRTSIKPFTIVNSNFRPSTEYVPIIPNKTYHQKGIFRAVLTDDTGMQIPVEARVTFDWRSRSVDPNEFIRSAEYSNIKIEDTNEVIY